MKKIIVFLLTIALTVFLFSCNSQGNFSTPKKASAADIEYTSYLKEFNIINNKKTYEGSYNLFGAEGNINIGDADMVQSEDSQIGYDYDAIILNENSLITGLNTLQGNNILVFNCDLVVEGEFSANFNIINYVSAGAFTENRVYIKDFFNNYRGIIGDDENFINLITLTIYSESANTTNGYAPFPWFTDYPYQHSNTTVDYAFMLPNVAIIKEVDTGYYYNTRNLVYIPLQTIYSNAQLDTIDISSYRIGGPNAGELRFYSYNEEPYYLSSLTIDVSLDGVEFLAYALNSSVSIDTNAVNEFKILFQSNDYLPLGENDGGNDYPTDVYEFLNNISPFVKVVIIEEETPPTPPPTPPDDGGTDGTSEDEKFYRNLGIIGAASVLVWFVPVFAIGLAVYAGFDALINKNNFGETFTTIFTNVVNKVIDFFTELAKGLLQFVDKLIEGIEQIPGEVPKIIKTGIAAGIVAIILLIVGFTIYQIIIRRNE